VTPDRSAPQIAGTTVNWTAAATGGTAPYQFKWWVFDGVNWIALTGWSTTTTFTWTPTVANPNYQVGVWVRSAGNLADTPEKYIAAAFPIAAPSLSVTSATVTHDGSAPWRYGRRASRVDGLVRTRTLAIEPSPSSKFFTSLTATRWGAKRIASPRSITTSRSGMMTSAAVSLMATSDSYRHSRC
jgi:hypothetical protein